VSFVLIILETIVRVITLALPSPIIKLFYSASRRTFIFLSSSQGKRSRAKKRAITSPIAKASDFVELCEVHGYYAEEHIVQTQDGYLLGVHRLGWRRGEEDEKVNQGEGSIQKKVVYLHHGLMMNSEVWVCLTEEERCLPFVLLEKGYDVWVGHNLRVISIRPANAHLQLGNNRGNKYSKKSTKFSPLSSEFWDFSIDQFAFHDIPDTIDYILDTTQQKTLSYVGFSQGTAQAFATLSIHPGLNEKVNVFVALAPAMAPPGLASGIVSSFVKATPNILFLLFGRKAMLSSTTMWEALLYPALFCWFIDTSLSFLFGWKSKNITEYQKLAAYPHLYSFASVKSVVHWFQIIRNGKFQMYDDEVQAPLSLANGAKYYKPAKYPTRNIRTPIVLLYGGSDSLVDIRLMLKELPKHTSALEIPHYEHLDFLWANDVHRLVIPHVLDALEFHSAGGRSKKEGGTLRRLKTPELPTYSETERSLLAPQPSMDIDSNDDADDDSIDAERRRIYRAGHSPHPSSVVATPVTPRAKPAVSLGSPNGSSVTAKMSHHPRPEGWWSSADDLSTGEDFDAPQDKAGSAAIARSATNGISKIPVGHASKLSIGSSKSSGSIGGHDGLGIGIGKGSPAQSFVSTENASPLRGSDGHSDTKAKKKIRKR